MSNQPIIPKGYRIMTDDEVERWNQERLDLTGAKWESAGSITGGVLWDNDGPHPDNCRCNNCK